MELHQIRDAIRQLPPAERQRLLDELLSEYRPKPDVLETAADVIAARKDLLRRLAQR